MNEERPQQKIVLDHSPEGTVIEEKTDHNVVEIAKQPRIVLDHTEEEIVIEEKTDRYAGETAEQRQHTEEPFVFVGPSPRPKKQKRQIVKEILRDIGILLRQILEDYGSRIFLLLLMIASLQLGDVIGFVYLTITVLLMISEITSNWSHGWISYTVVSFIVFGFQIYFIAADNLSLVTQETAIWIGFALTGGKSVGVFILNFFVFLISILLGVFLHLKKTTMSDKEYLDTRAKFRPILRERIREYRMNDARGGFSAVLQTEEDNAADVEELKSKFKSVRVRYYYIKARRFFRRAYHRNGFDFALFFLVILALNDLNLLSIIYLLIASYFAFSTSLFFSGNHAAERLKRLRWKWRVAYLLMGINFMREYFFSIWFPYSWDIDRLLIDADFTCDPSSVTIYSPTPPYSQVNDFRTCVDSWRLWLTLDVPSTDKYYIYFFTLCFMVLYDKYFYPINTNEKDYYPGDDLDFTNPNNRRLIDHFRFYYYCYFYLVPVVLFVGIGIRLNITGQTDLIGLVYFFLGLYLLLSYKKLLRKKNRTWRKIEILNIIILMLIILFQIPYMPCPIVHTGRDFISREECIALQEAASTVNANTLNRINSTNNWYTVVDIIGINKIASISFRNSYKEVLMMIFFLLAIIQRKIWQHPYVKAYVTPFYEKKDRYNHQIAARYVERMHLKRLMSFRIILLDKALAVHAERKLENKLKNWEIMFEKFIVPMKENEEDEPMEERRLVGQDEKTEKCYRIMDEVCHEVPEAKLLKVDKFELLVRMCGYKKRKVLKEVYDEIKKEKLEVLKFIRTINELNLPTKLGVDLVVVGLAFPQLRTPRARDNTTARREVEPGTLSMLMPGSFENVRIEKEDDEKDEKQIEVPQSIIKFKIEKEDDDKEENEKEENEEKGRRVRIVGKKVDFNEDEEEKRDDEDQNESPVALRVRTPKRRVNKLKTLKLEEVLLEAENPENTMRNRGKKLSSMTSPEKTEGELAIVAGVKRTKRGKFIEKINMWLIKHIRNSSLIGDVQAGLLIGEATGILLLKLLFVNMDKITFLMFIFNHIENGNILSVVYPLSVFLYGALEYPLPPARYWKIMMVYTILLLIVKFLYQSPFFCGTPTFSWNNIFDDEYGCSINYAQPWLLNRRVDYVIGIHKFTGDSSYPQNQGISGGLAWDLVVFFCMIIVRFSMDSAGIWNHMRIYNDFTYVPQLGDPRPKDYNIDYSPPKSKKRFRLPCFKKKKVQGEEDEPKRKRKWITPKSFLKNMFSYNRQMTGEAAIRKPGANLYVYTAPVSLIIMIYFIFFFSQMIGSGRSIQEELNQALFSGGVVIAIVVIIAIMLIERILFITRENLFQQATANTLEPNLEESPSKQKNKNKKPLFRTQFMWKIILHYVLAIGGNAFFLYAIITSRTVENANNYGYIYVGYLLCSVYLYISAQQIRFGYPVILDTRVFHSYDPITILLFKIYRIVPFLYEITSLLDWTMTPTSLALYQWMRVEYIFANLYLVKNSMKGRETHVIGKNRGKWERFTSGGILLIVLVFVIILPILLFSSLNPSTQLNNVISGTFTIELQAISDENNFRFTLYQVQNLVIQSLTSTEVKALDNINPGIGSYDDDQVQKIRIPTYSENEWLISLPSLNSLLELLERNSTGTSNSTIPFYVVANWYFTRENPRDGGYSQGINAVMMSEQQKADMRLLLNTNSQANITIPALIPKFLAITRLAYTYLLGPENLVDTLPFFTDASLTYVNDPRGRYWTLSNYREEDQKDSLFGPGDQMTIIVASDQALATILSALGSLGIVGFYVTITLAVGRIVRGIFAESGKNIILDELPEPDDLLELCDAIYLARKEGNLYKEEKLYYTLVRIFRSPEMLIELTGAFPKQIDPADENNELRRKSQSSPTAKGQKRLSHLV